MNRMPNNDDDDKVRLPESKFLKVQSLSELPKEQLEHFSEMYEGINSFFATIEGELMNGCENDLDRKTDALLRYMTFQQMQISALQQELGFFSKAIRQLGAAMDGKQDKISF